MAREEHGWRHVNDDVVRDVGFFMGIVLILAGTVAHMMGTPFSWPLAVLSMFLFMGPSFALSFTRAYRSGNGGDNKGDSDTDR